jgi:putative membrane protein
MSERRLHPAAAVAGAAEQLRGLAVPIVIAALVGGSAGGGRFLVYGLIGVAIALVGGVLTWRSERYWVDDSGVHHRRGVLRTQLTTIPIERVQGVDTVRGPVQRLFGVLELRIQSAGGAAGEVVLRALSPADADALRAALRVAGASAPAEATAPVERRLGTGALLLTAATAGQIGVLLPVVAAASQVVDDIGGSGDAARALVPQTVAGGLALAGAVIVLAWALSFAGAIVAFAGFTVTRDGDRLRIRRGLLQRRESAIPVSRIAAVRVVESPLRQPFGLAELRLESAGYGDDPRAARTLFPLVAAGSAGALLAEVLPEHDLPAVPLTASPGRARRRYVLGPLALSVAVALAAVAVFGAAGAAGLVLVAAAVALGLARHAAAGAAVADGRVVLRRRRLARVTLVADARRLQHVERGETVLTRRAGLASVGVGVASGTVVDVRLLEASAVDELVARLVGLAR